MIKLTSYFNKTIIKKFLGIDGALPFATTERFIHNPLAEVFQEFCSRVFLGNIVEKKPKIIGFLNNFINEYNEYSFKIYSINSRDTIDNGKLDNMLLDTYIVEYNKLPDQYEPIAILQ